MLALFSNFFLLSFRVDFLIVFWSFWGANMGRFWSQKSIKMRLMSFWFLLILYWFFHYFCVLGGLMLVLYRFFLRIVFCIDFLVDLGIDFGALLGAFGGSKSIIFGINFGMIFACRSKSGLRAPKSGPRAPKSAPRAPKRGPKGAKSGPRGAQERPRGAQERPQSTQWAAKRAKYVFFISRKPFGSIICI